MIKVYDSEDSNTELPGKRRERKIEENAMQLSRSLKSYYWEVQTKAKMLPMLLIFNVRFIGFYLGSCVRPRLTKAFEWSHGIWAYGIVLVTAAEIFSTLIDVTMN